MPRKGAKKNTKKTNQQKWGDKGANIGRKGGEVAYKAYKAYKMARRIYDTMNIEFKDYEETRMFNEIGDGTNNPAVSDSIVAHPLCVPQQGVGQEERIGQSIKLQRLSGRGRISWLGQTTPASGTVTAAVRLILFRGKAEQGKDYFLTDGPSPPEYPIFDDKGVIGRKKDETKYNTKFLYDKTYQLDISKTNSIPFNWNFPLNWHQNFIANGNQIQDAGLYLGILSDTGTAPKVEVLFSWNVSFTDD